MYIFVISILTGIYPNAMERNHPTHFHIPKVLMFESGCTIVIQLVQSWVELLSNMVITAPIADFLRAVVAVSVAHGSALRAVTLCHLTEAVGAKRSQIW